MAERAKNKDDLKTAQTTGKNDPVKLKALPGGSVKKNQKGDLKMAPAIRNIYRNHAGSVIMKSPIHKAESQMTALEKMKMTEYGISKRQLEQLKQKSRLDYNQLSRLLCVARATLISKKGASRFNEDISEKIVQLADLYSYGYEVFGDQENFNKWIFQANQAIGGKMPFDLLHNRYGREEIRSLVGRIDYGVYS